VVHDEFAGEASRAQQRLRAADAPVVIIADDLEAARWVVRAADWDPRVYAAVSK
jgi:TatD DNase family protein